jgi:hypothetical protein
MDWARILAYVTGNCFLVAQTSATCSLFNCRERLGGLLRYYHQEAA